MGDESESLTSLLGGSSAFHDAVKPEVQPQAEVKAEAAESEAKSQVRDEGGKFAKVEAEGKPEVKAEVQADPKVEKPGEQPAHVAAIIDERRRRQAAERELEELRQRVPQEAPKPPPSIFEDEEGAINQRVEAATSPLRGVLIDQSVKLAKFLHKDDWQSAEEGFFEAVKANPELVQQFRNAQDPGEFVYRAGVYHREMSKYGGDIVAMREAITAETTGKLGEATSRIQALEKEIAEMKASGQEVASVTKSLNSRSSGVVNAETQQDPDDLNTIVRFGNKSG